VDTSDRHVNTVAVSLAVYKRRPSTYRLAYTHCIPVSDSGLYDCCLRILFIWDVIVSV
jgi:hypothetical protein